MIKRSPYRSSLDLTLETLEPRRLLDAGPLVTELMAINRETLKDESRDYSDWIEIHNPTANPLSLEGWYLTDQPDNLTRWRMPAVTLAPGQYVVVFASGKDHRDPASKLHTNFKLAQDGEFLALVQTDGVTIHQQLAPQFPQQLADVSYGLAADLASYVYFATPTPGSQNVEGALGIVDVPRVSVERGFFESPLDVDLTSDTPEAQIRYTLDGSGPTSTTGIVYQGPIHVAGMTTLRAGAFKPGYLDSDVVTHTYLFVQDVLSQPDYPEGYPADWIQADGEVRPSVYGLVRGAVDFHQDTILDDLKSLPTISFVMDVDDLFGPGCEQPRTDRPCGAYNSNWANIDSPLSVELIYPDGREGFQIDAGVRLQGGSSRLEGVAKRNMRLRFSSEFGPTKLEFPLFGDSAVTSFDTIVLRANVQDGWHRGPAGDSQLIKDEFARRSQLATGQLSAHGTWAHLYINGLYWGLYNVTERPNTPFAVEYMGGDKDDWDEINGGHLREGNLVAWDAMIALTPRGGPDVRNFTKEIVDANYQAIQEFLDIEAFVDYIAVGQYMGTEDWLPNNYYAVRRSRDGDGPVAPDDPLGKFRFFHWDQEWSLLGVGQFKNLPGFVSPVGRIYQLLRLSDEFVQLQAQRLYKHYFNGGALSPEVAAARYQGLVDEVKDAIKGEAIRWGQAPSNVPGWETYADFIINTLIPGRPEEDPPIPSRREGVLGQYRRFGLYPKIDAPVFSQQGGATLPNQPLSLTAAAGDIYYSLDGSDPRLSDGTISPQAVPYTGPILLPQNTLVRARARADNEWSVFNEAQFFVGDPPAAGVIAITEINYNPSPPTPTELAIGPHWESNDFEFVELHNTSNQTMDLTGARFADGITFSFSSLDQAGQTMRVEPDQFVVLVRNREAFHARYGTVGIRVVGQYDGQLANDGERIRLEGPLGTTWLDFAYRDSDPWPQRADGDGATLELRDSSMTAPEQYDNPFAWRGSHTFGGSPAAAGPEPLGVVINEVLTRSDTAVSDSIELLNASESAVNIGGWFLSDSSDNFRKYQIQAGTMIGPGQYFVLSESQFNPNPNSPGPNHFALSGTRGDDVWLVIPDDAGGVAAFVDDVHFGAARSRQSFGRTPNGVGRLVPMTNLTLGGANSSPSVGPVILAEVNYHPDQPSPAALAIEPNLDREDLEFLEIHNPTNEAVSLANWQIRGGVDFDFPPAAQIGPSQTLVIVAFDPQDPANAGRLAAFRAHYGIGANVTLLGGYAGRLDNGGEMVQLLRADSPPQDQPTTIPRVLEDEVIYDDLVPWPTQADGQGGSLVRTAADSWGSAASSWLSERPSPGRTSLRAALPGDANEDGLFNQLDIVLVLQAGKYLTGQPATFAQGDWNGDGVFSQLDIVAALTAGSYRPGAAAIRDELFTIFGLGDW